MEQVGRTCIMNDTEMQDETEEPQTRKRRSSLKNIFRKSSIKSAKSLKNILTASGDFEVNQPSTSTTNAPFSDPVLIQPNVVQNVKTVFNAKIPSFSNMDLSTIQITLNEHLKKFSIYNAYQLCRQAGDRAVGYYFFTQYLVFKGVNDRDKDVFNNICTVMYDMYVTWSSQIVYLYPLVVNLNGADTTKELMNIINQSVYALIIFVMNEVLNDSIPEYFADLAFDAGNEQFEKKYFDYKNTFYSQNIQLTSLYNTKLETLTPVQKFFNNNFVTSTKILFEFKLKQLPVLPLITIPLKIITE